jgi:hypothetical protein
MDGNIVGLAAVVMVFGIPMAAMYTFFRVRKLRSEERLAAIARGVDVPMQPELSEAARSRRSGILLVAGALGYIVTFVSDRTQEPDAMIAATFGVIPLAVGPWLLCGSCADPAGCESALKTSNARSSTPVTNLY